MRSPRPGTVSSCLLQGRKDGSRSRCSDPGPGSEAAWRARPRALGFQAEALFIEDPRIDSCHVQNVVKNFLPLPIKGSAPFSTALSPVQANGARLLFPRDTRGNIIIISAFTSSPRLLLPKALSGLLPIYCVKAKWRRYVSGGKYYSVFDRAVKLTASVVLGIFTQISIFFTSCCENTIWKCNSYRYKKSQRI